MDAKKNICITISSLVSGGAEKQCLLLAKSLQKHHNIVVVVIKPEPIFPRHMDEIEKNNISIKVLTGSYMKRFIDFTSFLKTNKCEIVFSYLPLDITFSAICGRLAGVPYVVGGIRNDRIPKIKVSVLRFLHNRVLDYSISNSFGAYRFFTRKGFDKNKLMVIPNGIEIDSLPITRPSKEEIVIASLGRFVKQKDYETALKSISYLKEQLVLKKKIKYWVIGHGPEHEVIKGLAKSYGLSDEIRIIVAPENPLEMLRQSDIYLCTSVYEGLSNSIMEAISYSLPIVATRVGDNDRLVKHDENGWLVEPKDYKSIARYLHKLIHSTEDRNRMGKNGYQHLKAGYGYDRFQSRYLGVIAHIDKLQIENGVYRTATPTDRT